jgi:hypothetical protein
MFDSSLIVTSDYSNLSSGNIRGRLGRTSATTGQRGRARMTITIQAEPLVHNFDELMLGKGPSEAIAKRLREKVEAIGELASERTLETRKYQEKAFHEGKPWAMSRFTGGRMGPTPPRDGGGRMFNHSGRTAQGIVATENRTEKNWTVNVAANRLDPRTSRNASEFAHITDALRRLVPEIDDPVRLMADPEVKAALEQSIADMIVQARNLNQKLREQRLRSALGIVKQLSGGFVSTLFSP